MVNHKVNPELLKLLSKGKDDSIIYEYTDFMYETNKYVDTGKYVETIIEVDGIKFAALCISQICNSKVHRDVYVMPIISKAIIFPNNSSERFFWYSEPEFIEVMSKKHLGKMVKVAAMKSKKDDMESFYDFVTRFATHPDRWEKAIKEAYRIADEWKSHLPKIKKEKN